MNVPRATYRLQFNRHFTFQDAAAVLDYLKELGISDVYASPIFRAGAESTHGYDICHFEEINPALGNFDGFARHLHERGLGLVVDMVPNHMGNALANPWWVDVLRNGRLSQYAEYFDVDWDPPDPSLKGKVLVPVLEDHYDRVLEAGKLKVGHVDGNYTIDYHEHHFPVAPDTLKFVKSDLHELLQRQHYRLAWWRIGSQQINYRRFFDVNDLISLRMERKEVFEATHRLLFSLIAEGKIAGLRIDHPDGLWDPKHYFERLRKLGIWVVAEKILTEDESLPVDWPVAGTTGYDFLNRVNGLFINRANEGAFTDLYKQFTGNEADFDTVAYACKRRVLELSFQSELTSLSKRLRALAAATRSGQDLTLSMLREAIEEVVAAFPVYRTYVSHASTATDRHYVKRAIGQARQRNRGLDPVALAFLESRLLEPDEFAMRFQQLTGPVMAKGLEDTAFYRFTRFISLNDVGGSPDRFGISVDDFHKRSRLQLKRWPHTQITTSTHDTKRGEDVRARLNVLSEIPNVWKKSVWRWRRLNEDKKVRLKNGHAPDANDEYLLYQTLIGAWPHDADTSDGLKRFRDRVTEYMLKALREAKSHTNWTEPDLDYENAVTTFVERILSPAQSKAFLKDFGKLQSVISHFGVFNSLSQAVLKLTSPGVPDFYQGSELWDLSLVDPDNRRPVDFALRQKLLQRVKRDQENLLADTRSGAAKLFTIWKALRLRAEIPALFKDGEYIPLRVFGAKAEHICAFARRTKDAEVAVIVPRLPCGLCRGKLVAPLGAKIWRNTSILLPRGEYQDQITGTRYPSRRRFALAEVLRDFPVALLLRRECP